VGLLIIGSNRNKEIVWIYHCKFFLWNQYLFQLCHLIFWSVHLSLNLILYPLHALISLLNINLPHALILDLSFWVLIALPSHLKTILLYAFSLDLFFVNLNVVFQFRLKKPSLWSTSRFGFLGCTPFFKTITLEHRNFKKDCRSSSKLVNVETYLKNERIENEKVGNEWGSANMNCP